jgi:hypothetical protein
VQLGGVDESDIGQKARVFKALFIFRLGKFDKTLSKGRIEHLGFEFIR